MEKKPNDVLLTVEHRYAKSSLITTACRRCEEKRCIRLNFGVREFDDLSLFCSAEQQIRRIFRRVRGVDRARVSEWGSRQAEREDNRFVR